jgi:hypothetical protein
MGSFTWQILAHLYSYYLLNFTSISLWTLKSSELVCWYAQQFASCLNKVKIMNEFLQFWESGWYNIALQHLLNGILLPPC